MSQTYQFTEYLQRKILTALWIDNESYGLYQETIKPKYFSNQIHTDICRIIFDYRAKYGDKPTLEALIEEVTELCKPKHKQSQLESYLTELNLLKETELFDLEYVKDKIIAFGRQKALVGAILESADIAASANQEQYAKIETSIKQALLVGQEVKDLGTDFFEGIEERIKSYSERPTVIEKIPTNIQLLDRILQGGLGRSEMGVIVAPPGTGKALLVGTKVLTPSGYTCIENLQVGDLVITVDGTATRVTGVYPHKKKSMYLVDFTIGSCICCDEHLWELKDGRVVSTAELKVGDSIPKLESAVSAYTLNPTKQSALSATQSAMQTAPTQTDTATAKQSATQTAPTQTDTTSAMQSATQTAPTQTDTDNSVTQIDTTSAKQSATQTASSQTDTDNSVTQTATQTAPTQTDTYSHIDTQITNSIDTDIEAEDKPIYPYVLSDALIREDYTTLAELGIKSLRIPRTYLQASIRHREDLLFQLIRDFGLRFNNRGSFTSKSKGLLEDIAYLADSLGFLSNISGNQITVSREDNTVKSIKYFGKFPAVCISVEHPSQLYVIQGGIVTHNTTTLTALGAGAVLQGYNVVHISLENNEAQVLRNYETSLLKKPFEFIRNNVDTCIKSLLFMKNDKHIGGLRVKKYPTKGANTSTLKTLLERYKIMYNFNPDLLIVDYGAILGSTQKFNDHRFQIESNYEGLRAIADEYNIALWTAAQANRGSLSKEIVSMVDLAECFAIGNVVDVMICLCQTPSERKKEELRLWTPKIRDNADNKLLRGKILYATKQIEMYEILGETEESDNGTVDTNARNKHKDLFDD